MMSRSLIGSRPGSSVAQELEAEALAFARALDEARHIGHGEARLARLDDAEVGVQRREGVVGYLRPRGRECRDEARLARARVTHEGHVGDRLELEDDIALPTLGAEQRESGRLAFGSRQRLVAQTALATRCDHDAHTRFVEVGELGAVGVAHDRADRHGQHERPAGEARAVVAHAGAAVLAHPVRPAVVAQQSGLVSIRHQNDVAAIAAVAAIGAGERLELLTAH